MKRHLVILFLLTFVVRGVLFVSYPMGGRDDNQSAQRFMISELLHGNLHIGNLRYQTGYPLMIAPVEALAQPFGRLSDRIVLLVQVAISSAIPFLIYDILRVRRSPREALVVALFVLFDPFGLQWAHFAQPEWLIAFFLALALWLVHRAVQSPRRLLLVALAGLGLGASTVARLNVGPVVALLGLCLFLLPSLSWRTRFAMFVTLGVASVAVLGVYAAAIHYPSTGTWTLNCSGGVNMMNSITSKGVPIVPENGDATRRYLSLLTLPTDRELPLFAAQYPLWRVPGHWVTWEEQRAFLSQPPGDLRAAVPISRPEAFMYYLGQCPSDTLFRQVHAEAVAANPAIWLKGILEETAYLFVQMDNPRLYRSALPAARDVTVDWERGRAGFYPTTRESDFYSGQWVWYPGIQLFSLIYPALNLVKLLLPPGIIRSLLAREWTYRTAGILLVGYSLMLAAVDNPELRTYAAVYPLAPILTGAVVYWTAERVLRRRVRQPQLVATREVYS